MTDLLEKWVVVVVVVVGMSGVEKHVAGFETMRVGWKGHGYIVWGGGAAGHESSLRNFGRVLEPWVEGSVVAQPEGVQPHGGEDDGLRERSDHLCHDLGFPLHYSHWNPLSLKGNQ